MGKTYLQNAQLPKSVEYLEIINVNTLTSDTV